MTTFVETPIYDALLATWKSEHDGREPGDVPPEPVKAMPPRPRARKRSNPRPQAKR